MSKIICDVCGTSYPDSATHCPICGCVRSIGVGMLHAQNRDAKTADNSTYTYVKGGRFSKSNVRKRNNAQPIKVVSGNKKKNPVNPVEPEKTVKQETAAESGKQEKKTGKGLVAAVIILLVAIMLVVVFISVMFFFPALIGKDNLNDIVSTIGTEDPANTSPVPTTEATQPVVPCTGLTISKATAEFHTTTDVLLLDVTTQPKDTTDSVSFSSDNEAVAKVDNDGKIEPVGNGQAIITVVCGEITAQCRVTCDLSDVPQTQPTDTQPAQTQPSESNAFQLNRDDFTLSGKGDSWVLYNGSIPKSSISWKSDNEAVATVENGKVVAVGPGTTTIRAEYNGTKCSCIVRCSFQ